MQIHQIYPKKQRKIENQTIPNFVDLFYDDNFGYEIDPILIPK